MNRRNWLIACLCWLFGVKPAVDAWKVYESMPSRRVRLGPLVYAVRCNHDYEFVETFGPPLTFDASRLSDKRGKLLWSTWKPPA